jgi:hypothetical protein
MENGRVNLGKAHTKHREEYTGAIKNGSVKPALK